MKIRDFDISTARLGQTLRHAISQNCYTVADVRPAKGEHDTFVVVKSVRGQLAVVGSEFIDPDGFVELVH